MHALTKHQKFCLTNFVLFWKKSRVTPFSVTNNDSEHIWTIELFLRGLLDPVYHIFFVTVDIKIIKIISYAKSNIIEW